MNNLFETATKEDQLQARGDVRQRDSKNEFVRASNKTKTLAHGTSAQPLPAVPSKCIMDLTGKLQPSPNSHPVSRNS